MKPIESSPSVSWFGRLHAWDLSVCILAQHRSTATLRRGFAIVSWLGNGWFWLVLGLLLVTLGAFSTLLELFGVVALCLLCYRLLKRGTARPRPYSVSRSLHAMVPALDLYSFPSGHTLHAVAINTTLALHLPWLAVWVLPFTLLVAASRVVLGLHYPTDVLAGTVLGLAIPVAVHTLL